MKQIKQDTSGKVRPPNVADIAFEAVERNLVTRAGITWKLRFPYRDEKVTVRLPRGQATVQGLLRLRADGAPVTEQNLKPTLEYLQRMEDRVPLEYYHDQVGSVKVHDQRVFIFEHAVGHVASRYTGTMDIAPRGSLDAQLAFVRAEVLPYPDMALAFALGLLALLMPILNEAMGLESFSAVFVGPSGSGKTTALTVGGFSFGRPTGARRFDQITQRQYAGLMQTWSGTENALMNQLGGNYGVPVLVDEIGLARGDGLKRIPYAVGSNMDRARMGQENTVLSTATWATVLLATGEVSWREKAGTLPGIDMRLMEIRRPQWTVDREHAERIAAFVREEYGHIAPQFARHLLAVGDEAIIATYQRCADECRARLGKSTRLSDRMANKLGAIMAAAELARDGLDLEIDLEALWAILLQIEGDAAPLRDIGAEAYRRLRECMVEYPQRFRKAGKTPVEGDIWGYIDADDSEVAITQTVFSRLLREWGLPDAKVVESAMREKGVVKKDRDGRNPKREKGVRMHVFRLVDDLDQASANAATPHPEPAKRRITFGSRQTTSTPRPIRTQSIIGAPSPVTADEQGGNMA